MMILPNNLLIVIFLCGLSWPANSQYLQGIQGIFIPTNITSPYQQGAYGKPLPPYPTNNANPSNYGWVQPSLNRNAFETRNQTTTNQHNWVVGSRQHGDNVLFKTYITKVVGFLRSSAEKIITFPDPNSKRRVSRITSIIVEDMSKKGNGGSFKVLRGGVGQNFVELQFKSVNGKKIDLGLTVYGFE